MGFWRNFWKNLKALGETEAESDRRLPAKVQQWTDYKNYNPLDIVVSKVTVLSMDEATIDLESDSSLTKPLQLLCDDAEAKRYELCSMMLGEGGCFVTLATGDNGQPYHIIARQSDVSVYEVIADKMRDVAIIIERKIVKHKEYRLVRRHFLDEQETLWVEYYTTDKNGNKEYLAEWEHYENEGVKFLNANHIGVAYFKSPQNSRGLEPFFGVPLNFGCEEIEEQIRKDRQALADEMENAAMILFADESIVKADKKPKEIIDSALQSQRYKLPERLYTIRKKAGVDGSLIDSFAPATRYEDYKKKLNQSCMEYEDQIGLNRGFLTDAERTAGATATEIRTANIKTISTMKKVQSAMHDGIKNLLEADSMFLGIFLDLWSLKVDWYNPFEDEATQWKNLLEAYDKGAAEIEDLVLFRFPNLSPKEIAEKVIRINENKKADMASALDKMFMGG